MDTQKSLSSEDRVKKEAKKLKLFISIYFILTAVNIGILIWIIVVLAPRIDGINTDPCRFCEQLRNATCIILP